MVVGWSYQGSKIDFVILRCGIIHLFLHSLHVMLPLISLVMRICGCRGDAFPFKGIKQLCMSIGWYCINLVMDVSLYPVTPQGGCSLLYKIFKALWTVWQCGLRLLVDAVHNNTPILSLDSLDILCYGWYDACQVYLCCTHGYRCLHKWSYNGWCGNCWQWT